MNASVTSSGLPQGPRVLIVEDERVVATHVERSLRDAGYNVTGIAGSAHEASELLEEGLPDVALVDIRLQGKAEGFELAEYLQVERGVPVVYMTAHTDDDTLQRAARTAPYGYVVKPFTIGEVKSALQVALYKHGLDRHIAERERWFSTTLRAIADAVVACDARQRVTFVNSAAEILLGCAEHDVLGFGLDHLLGADFAPISQLTGAMEDLTPMPFACELAREGEASLQVEGHVAPIVYGERLLGAVLVLHDVSERKRREEQLALTDRLSSLGTLVASVAHEINNPLAYTLGNLGLAVNELERVLKQVGESSRPVLERVIRSLRDAEDGAGRVAKTVKELRAFGRMEERSLRAIDPRACLDWAVRLTGNQLLHQTRLLTSFGDVPKVMANELKLSQVFVNLLTNASQAMHGERADNEIRISTSTDENGYAVIVVEDNGRGMSEEVQRAAFEPFFTTKPVGTGTGLGLSICRDIIRDFGGEIRLESELGKGSRFTVSLPASSRQLSEPPSARGQPPPSSASGTITAYRPRVLVIDDEPMLRSLVGKLLFGRFRVMSVESVRLALIELNASRDYDAILCDLMMPGESGMDFFAVLRRLYPELAERVGFITGGALTPDTLSFLESSGRPVLSKPFDARALQSFVGDLLGLSATQEACPP